MCLGLVCQRRARRSGKSTLLLTAHKLGYWSAMGSMGWDWHHPESSGHCLLTGLLKKLKIKKAEKKSLSSSKTLQHNNVRVMVKSHYLNCHCDHVTQYFQRTASEHVHNPHIALNCELRLWDLQMRLLPYQSLWCEDSALLCCTWPDLFFPPTDLFRFLLFS